MKKVIKYMGIAVLSLSMVSTFYVSALAWYSPAEVMNLVDLKLNNTDSISSIRGVYGGVGFVFLIMLAYVWRKSFVDALRFQGIFWLFYAFSRVVTLFFDGPLGDFGTKWLKIELTLGLLCVMLSFFVVKKNNTP